MKKKVISCFLAIALAAGLAGCGSGSDAGTQTTENNNSAKTDESEAKDEPEGGEESEGAGAGTSKYQTTYGSKQFDNVTITVELFDRSNAPDGSTITDNKWTKYVNEEMNKVGINVDFVAVPRGDEITKMQTMVASQTAPDITLTYTYAYAEDYFNQGGTWDLSEFIDGDDQAQNMKAYLGKDVIDLGRNANDELYGRSDIIGCIVNNIQNLRVVFSKVASDPLEVEIASQENVVQDYYDEGMREYYRFMNKLYNDGLLHQEYYTLAEDDFKTYIVTGTVATFEYNVNGNVDVLRGSLLKTLQENDPDADIVSIPPIANFYDGEPYVATYSPGGLIAFCPKTADEETVEACMTYLDWMCTEEGGFVLYHGFEGEHFEYDESGIPIVKDAEYNAQDKDWIRTDLFLTGNQGYFATVEDFNICTSKEAPGYEDNVIANYENSLAGNHVVAPTYTSPSTPDLITDLNLIKDEYSVKSITCATADFDATYDEYMKELEATGIQTIIDERTEYYTNR